MSRRSRLKRTAVLLLGLAALAAAGALKVPPAALEQEVVEDLPSPFNFQVNLIRRSVSLSWQWEKPDLLPDFKTFGYEIERDGRRLTAVPQTAYGDIDLSTGTHVYRVRVRGDAKERGQKVSHVSAWTEPRPVALRETCPSAPVIHIQVAPTRRTYDAPTSLNFRLSGDVQVPAGCSLLRTTYHIDTGAGITHTGPLTSDAKGHFDEVVAAVGPEDEPPTGQTQFDVTVTAEDEAGPVTSDQFSLTMQLENKFAPKP